MTRLNGRPSAYLAISRFTQNSVVNRPLPISVAGPGRGHHRRHRAPAAPGVLAPPVHHPPHPDPPGNLLADILPQQLIGPAAPPAAPLAFREVMNLLLGLQMLMPALAMPLRPRPLTAAPAPARPGSPGPPSLPPAGRFPSASGLPGPFFSLEVPNSIRLSVTTRCLSASTCCRRASAVPASVAFSAASRVASASQNSARQRHNAASSAAGREHAGASITPTLRHHHSLCPAPPQRRVASARRDHRILTPAQSLA